MRLGDLDALKEDFKSRLADCNEWIEKAKDKETKIRAGAVKAFIGEVIMTINNAPTVEIPTELCKGCRFLKDCETCEEKLRPQGEWIERTERITLDTYYECSNCKEPWTTIDGTPWQNMMNYCPNCGADMRGKAE